LPLVAIRPWAEGDLPLVRQLMGDPAMTVHLGGPESEEKLLSRYARYLASNRPGNRMFVITVGEEEEPAGSVGYWERDHQGEAIYETGWSVIPAFQGRGIASRATALSLERAARDGGRRYVHAFPSTDNEASNAVCRKLGFELLGVIDFEFPPGHVMPTNDWRYDLLSMVEE
jgi:RimJ/RimL family protein N-acetyltransferase